MTTQNPFKAIKKSTTPQKGRGLKEPPKLEDMDLIQHKKEHSPAVEAGTPRRSYKI